jgi:TRAP-type C4-dicarboxylate transport system permease small subunit
MPGRIKTGVETAARVLRFAGQLALGSMVVTICYDVIMRYVFRAPTLWSLEINTFLVLFITLLPAGDVLASGSHLRISFFADKLSKGVQRALEKLTCLLGCLFGAMMTWKGFNMAYLAFQYNERMSTPLGTPLGIPYAMIPLGFSVMVLYYAVSFFEGYGSEKTSAQPEV